MDGGSSADGDGAADDGHGATADVLADGVGGAEVRSIQGVGLASGCGGVEPASGQAGDSATAGSGLAGGSAIAGSGQGATVAGVSGEGTTGSFLAAASGQGGTQLPPATWACPDG